ncbi:MAG: diguanylate cyclase domain-containing protein [Arcobacter sp.]|uniref:diguanylate cyclase domain-containing protein n=1 Tax=Arcobacter sp. TaxID=1872629 RepID=UPI003AFFE4E9
MSILRKWILKQPIQKKLAYSSIFGIMVAFVPIIFVMVIYEYFALRNTTLEKVWTQANIIAESSSATLAFKDNIAAKEILLTLQGAHDLLEAHLILPDGTIFESYYRNKSTTKKIKVDPITIPQEIINTTRITVKKPIFLRSSFVGSLEISSSLENFYTRLIWYAIIITSITSIGFLLAWWVAIRVSKTITEPLSNLTATTQQIMKNGDYTMEMPIFENVEDEVGSLSNAFAEMMSQIHERDLSLQKFAYYDRVTGIPNRHYFEERIAQTVNNAKRYGTVCYLLMIDLDDFKIVNDTLGHHIGDELLRYVSDSLKNTMRQSDSIFRIGGDEFAVIIESNSLNESVEQIAQKIIKAISTPTILDGHDVKVGASIGISCFPKFSSDVITLMSSADMAMYVAKKGGKNNYQLYQEDFSSK